MSVSSLKAGGNGGMHKVTRWMVSMVAITTFASTWYTEPVAAGLGVKRVIFPRPIDVPVDRNVLLTVKGMRRWNAILQRITSYKPEWKHQNLYRNIVARLNRGDIQPTLSIADAIEKAPAGPISHELVCEIGVYLVNLLLAKKTACPLGWTDDDQKKYMKIIYELMGKSFGRTKPGCFTFD